MLRVMVGIFMGIPEEIQGLPGIPHPQLKMEILRRLVATMYADGLVGGSSACMMVCPEKNELHLWMCEHEVIPPLTCDECELERRNHVE